MNQQKYELLGKQSKENLLAFSFLNVFKQLIASKLTNSQLLNMKLYQLYCLVFLMILSLQSFGQTKKKWKGQGPIQKVSTRTKPIQKQDKGTFDLGKGVYCSNDFVGARLNGAVWSQDTILALITPENTPINPSPWYCFQIWAEQEQEVYLKLTYLDGVKHRYYPKISTNGVRWEDIDEADYFEGELIALNESRKLPKDVTIRLNIGPEKRWVSAQELMTSKHNKAWINRWGNLPFVTTEEIGKSREGRPIQLMKIGESDDKKMIMVISRQHPPEVTGYLAMQAFVETICGESETAVAFRKNYNTYVIPMMNPDGVDNGHWRHGAGGIDLNRDWQAVNQPEVEAAQKFMKDKLATSGGKFYFAVDFHSTWEDIYYTINPDLEGNMPGLVPEMIAESSAELEGYEPNIRPTKDSVPGPTSSSFFFYELKAEALTFEIGDNTPRDLLRKKGKLSAMKLMEIMLKTKP